MAIKPRPKPKPSPPRPNTAAIDIQTINKLSDLIDHQTRRITYLESKLDLQQAVITGLQEALAGLQSRTWCDEVDMTTGEVTKSQPHHRRNP